MRKEIECEIVQDLLLNYNDGVLNEKSKEFVEKHLNECKNCKNRLNDIRNDLEKVDESQEKEVDYLKKVKRKISKKNRFIIIGSILLAIIIIFNLFVFINYSQKASEMEVFLQDSVTEQDMDSIIQTIKSYDENAEIIYYSQQDNLEKMKEKFADKAYLLNGYEENSIFPASYKVKSKLSKIREIEQNLMLMPAVKKITSRIDTNPYELFIGQFFIYHI